MSLSINDIDRVAAEWAAKISGGHLTPAEESSFASWHEADVRHQGAFARAEAVLLRLDRLCVIGPDALRTLAAEEASSSQPGLPEDGPSTAGSESLAAATIPRFWTRRRMVLTGSTAACFVTAGIVGSRPWNSGAQRTFATEVGETRTVHLSDGSLVTLNTNSKMSVSFTDAERRIVLDQGEALFDVAKNKSRPFVVAAFDTEVRAIGTRFGVRLLPARPIQILVQEGVVEVKRRDASSAKPVRAVAETRAEAPLGAPIVVRAVSRPQLARDMAWRFGRIAFENERLADASVEFARYSNVRIVVDPAIADRTITGLFSSNDPVGFAKVAASILDLHVEVEPEEVRLVR